MKNILLLHGWGYNNYTKITSQKTPWHSKQEFINELKMNYNIYMPFFPGFCGEKEPKKPYDLDDYAYFVDRYIKTNNLKIDFILGNSFGGEVATRYKTLINPTIPIILIVPAILRITSNNKTFIKTPKIIQPLRNIIRDLYVIYIKKTPEMKYGTKFLRNSYQKIVRYNLINEVSKFKPKDVLILLGDEDTMVDTTIIYDELSSKFKQHIYKINGGHEIAKTHKKEVISYINKFISD